MEIIRLYTEKKYKSLKPGFEILFNSKEIGKIEPICFVGLNGTGKSNIIELIAEIFAFLNKQFLDYVPATYKNTNLKFEIEYSLIIEGKKTHVKVSNLKSKKVDFLKAENNKLEAIPKQEQEKYLPSKIIGYTSGQNETLSIPFSEIQTYYAEEVTNQALGKGKTKKREIKTPRFLLMDYETNILIAITNSVYNKDKWGLFEDQLRIKELDSFRLILQYKHKQARGKDGILRTPEIYEYEEALKKCSTSYREEELDKKEERIILDFFINDAARTAFSHYFKTGTEFFEALYKLVRLNILIWEKRERVRIKNLLREQKKLEKLPLVPPSYRAVNFDNIKIRITEPEKIIYYIGVSDGEHQFIHVFGTFMLFDSENVLYLFDEPETHFNPIWRTQFVSIVNTIISKFNQEILISSHSPYILSGIYGRNVFLFKRGGEINKVEETYGASFEYLLSSIFDAPPVAKIALDEFEGLHEEEDIYKIKEKMSQFGESIEKDFLYQRINYLEKKQAEQQKNNKK